MSVRCLARRLSRTTPFVPCLASPSVRQTSSTSIPAPDLCESDRPYGTRKYDPRDYGPKDAQDDLSSPDLRFRARLHSNYGRKEEIKLFQEMKLFEDPAYFTTPVLMLHCQYSDFAVSFHAPDKLNEEDCLWSSFTHDLKIYGSKQRTHPTAIKLILTRARAMLKKQGVEKLRIVTKGYNFCLTEALKEIQDNFDGIEFVSITDQSRKLGEESVVLQRGVPRYPDKLSLKSMVSDLPEHAPQNLVEKFRRLNVYLVNIPPKKGKLARGETAPDVLVLKDAGDKASRRGFVTKKSTKRNAGKKAGLKPLQFDPNKIGGE